MAARDPRELRETILGELRAEMARQRLNQARLAGKLGWSDQQLSTRMTGEVDLRLLELLEIADVLGLEPARLLSAPTPSSR